MLNTLKPELNAHIELDFVGSKVAYFYNNLTEIRSRSSNSLQCRSVFVQVMACRPAAGKPFPKAMMMFPHFFNHGTIKIPQGACLPVSYNTPHWNRNVPIPVSRWSIVGKWTDTLWDLWDEMATESEYSLNIMISPYPYPILTSSVDGRLEHGYVITSIVYTGLIIIHVSTSNTIQVNRRWSQTESNNHIPMLTLQLGLN